MSNCYRILGAKNAEYARGDGDRLSNFRAAAEMQKTTPERALSGMFAKHVISIMDFCNDTEKGMENPYTLWEEKITDAINYLILLDALLQERLNISHLGQEPDMPFLREKVEKYD
jgi:hypothetical protein